MNLHKSGELLKQTSQPHNFLIETIEQRDAQLDQCQRLIDHLENEVANLKQEYLLSFRLYYSATLNVLRNDELTKQKNALDAQCRQLLGQESKVLALRRLVEQMQARTSSPNNLSISHPFEEPAPMEISSAPLWYQKLRTKN